MNVVVIIFMIVSTLFALGSLAYVVVDVILEVMQRKEPEEEPKEEAVEAVAEPVVVPEPVEEMPEIVEHIDAKEADEMISDELAMKTVRYESPAGHGKQGIINIGAIDAFFEADETVTISALKAKGLIPKSVGRMKVLANGMLNKPLTVKAESFSIQAIKMIELTGGTVVILRD